MRCFKWDGGEKGNRMPDVVAAETGATPAAFYLGLCRLRGILSPPASATVILQECLSSAQLRWCCRRAVLSCSSDGAAAILKSGLEIKKRCSLWAILEGFLASIPKSGPEIKNRCSLWAVLEGFLASIPKSGLEIKNHCTQEAISGQNMQRFASLGLKSRIDARRRAETGKSLHRFPSLGLKSRIDARKRV